MQMLARVLTGLVLLALAGFCLFGFLATYEYRAAADRLPWQFAYGSVGLICLGGIALLFRRH